MTRSTLRFAVGLAGAACGAAGDWLLTGCPAVPGAEPWRWRDVVELVRHIPAESQLAGHFLGVFGLPLTLVGFAELIRGCRPAGRAWVRAGWIAALATYLVGTVYHGQLALLGSALRATDALGASATPEVDRMLREAFVAMWIPLGAVSLGAAFLSIWWPAVVLLRPTRWPRWMAALSPGLVLAALTGLGRLLPEPGRQLVDLTSFNLSAGVLLAVALAVRTRSRPSRTPTARPTDP